MGWDEEDSKLLFKIWDDLERKPEKNWRAAREKQGQYKRGYSRLGRC